MILQGNIYAIASWTQRYCLPDSNLYIGRNPETLSRVTLASLGIVFQTKIVFLYCPVTRATQWLCLVVWLSCGLVVLWFGGFVGSLCIQPNQRPTTDNRKPKPNYRLTKQPITNNRQPTTIQLPIPCSRSRTCSMMAVRSATVSARSMAMRVWRKSGMPLNIGVAAR